MRHFTFALLALAACAEPDGSTGDSLLDPLSPGAAGTIALAAGVTADGYTVLALRLDAIDVIERPQEDDIAIPPFPYEFGVGFGIGGGSAPTYRLRIWLDTVTESTSPPDGAPRVETMIQGNCSEGGSCGGEIGLALTLAR